MKNATVVLSVVFQLNREWMITALLQAKYLNSINGLKKNKNFYLGSHFAHHTFTSAFIHSGNPLINYYTN